MLEVSIDSGCEGIGLSPAEDTREVLHDDRISIQSGKGLSISILPTPQNQSFSFKPQVRRSHRRHIQG